MLNQKNPLITQLEREILPLQGIRSLTADNDIRLGIPAIEAAFPNATFPIGCTHEFVCSSKQSHASTNGFIAGIIGRLMSLGGVCLYISTSRTLFPASLKRYGVEPHQIIFIDLKKEEDVLYATEEALKCGRITAVVSEISNIGFKESRRFQLAAEGRRTTAFLLRNQFRATNTIASVSRWHITSAASGFADELPGVGFPRWNIELQKVRNGRPGRWQVEWTPNGFTEVGKAMYALSEEEMKEMRG